MAGFSNTIEWRSSSVRRPAFRARANGVFVPGTGTDTKLSFPTEDEDVGGFYNTSLSRYLPQVPGWYQFNVSSRNDDATGFVFIRLYLNGATVFGIGSVSDLNYLTCSGTIYLNGTTDYVEVFVRQSSGTGYVLNTFGYFNGVFIGS